MQGQVDCLENEAKQKSKEMANLEMMLEERNLKIFQLKQKILSQEEKIQEQGISLHQKAILLSDLTILVEQLFRAQDEQQCYDIKKKLCELAATYYQKHAEELKSMV